MATKKKASVQKSGAVNQARARQQLIASFIYLCSVVAIAISIFITDPNLTQGFVDKLALIAFATIWIGIALAIYLNILHKGNYWPIISKKRKLSEAKAAARAAIMQISYGKLFIINIFLVPFAIFGDINAMAVGIGGGVVIMYGLALPAITASFRKDS